MGPGRDVSWNSGHVESDKKRAMRSLPLVWSYAEDLPSADDLVALACLACFALSAFRTCARRRLLDSARLALEVSGRRGWTGLVEKGTFVRGAPW